MNKIFIVFITLFFLNIINAQEDIIIKYETVDGVVVDSNDNHSKLYLKIKNNKYVKYGIVTTVTLVCLGGAIYLVNNALDKRGNYCA